jgi:hypothetical protein
MPHFMVWRACDDEVEAYWVLAASPADARRQIAGSVPAAMRAENVHEYECVQSDENRPPRGVICTSDGTRFAVKA